ncbi:MAG: hypothetical protein ABSH56_33950 [Bryobacteraceae bacterium]|jgi:hypothetical protein
MSDQPNVPASKPRDPRALNAYRHGLTGQVHILTPDDEVAYQKHCAGIHESFAPVGGMETELVQAIADDRWSLGRAVGIEGSIFAIGVGQPTHGTSGNPQVDVALAQARVWLSEGKNLQLLSLYQHRIQRRVEKNKKMLDDLQQQRHSALERVAEEVALLTQLAASKGETYDIERDYPRQTFPPQFDFSIPEIARLATHLTRLAEAKKLLQSAPRPLRKAA